VRVFIDHFSDVCDVTDVTDADDDCVIIGSKSHSSSALFSHPYRVVTHPLVDLNDHTRHIYVLDQGCKSVRQIDLSPPYHVRTVVKTSKHISSVLCCADMSLLLSFLVDHSIARVSLKPL